MKKFAIGIIAITFAVIGFAFSTAKKAQTDYVWFKVKPGTGILCANFTSVTQADLEWIPRTGSQTIAQAIAASGQELLQSEATTFFDCPPTDTYVCAVGYDVNTTNFQIYTDPQTQLQYVRPLPNISELSKICRPTL